MNDGRQTDTRIRVLTLGRDVGRCFGGAERVAFDFVEKLDTERFKPYLCITRARPAERRALNDEELAQLEANGVTVLLLERSSPGSHAAWTVLYRLLRRESIDIVHAHMPRAAIPGTLLGRLARVPVIINHEHSWSFEGRPVRRFLDRNLLARGSDMMLAVSELDRRRMIELERIPPESVRVLPNGIPEMNFNGRDVRGELDGEAGVGLIGSIGRLYPVKGHDDLVRAVALLRRDGVALKCVIAGIGPDAERLSALIDECGVGDAVTLLGRRGDVPDVLRALDVAVMSSTYEGSPLAMIEYMACGVPIVATAVGGIPELIEDETHGLLVEARRPEQLAAAIRRLLEDRALASRLGEAARRRQHDRFDLDAVVSRLEALYVELYRGSRRARAERLAAALASP